MSEWTTVVGRHNGSRATMKATTNPIVEIYSDLDIQMIVKEYRGRQQAWESSRCAQEVRERVAKAVHYLPAQYECGHAVCLGLGSVTKADPDGTTRNRLRSLWQLAVFLFVVDLLGGTRGRVLASDPAFTKADVIVLESLGVRVPSKTDVIRGENVVFLFAPFLEHMVLLGRGCLSEDTLDRDCHEADDMERDSPGKGPQETKTETKTLLSDPWLFIGSDLTEVIEVLEMKESSGREGPVGREIKTAKAFLKHRTRWTLPDFELHPYALRGLTMYQTGVVE